MPRLLRALLFVSIFSAAACAAAHVLTFADIAFYPVLLFVPLLFLIWPLVVWRWRQVPGKNLISEVFGNVPRWMKVLTAVLLTYIFANFFLSSWLNDFATPLRENGQLVLKEKNRIVRILTDAEFQHAQAVHVRMLTGHLFAFFSLATLAVYAIWLKSGPAMTKARV